MDKELVLLGFTCIIGGLLTANKKINEKFIRVDNKVRGIKSAITPATLKIQQVFGIILIFIGILVVVWGIVIR